MSCPCVGTWWENLNVRNHLENLGVDGITLLKWILKKHYGRAWIGLI